MPYVRCPDCSLTTYAIARERCPRCGTTLNDDERERQLQLVTQTARRLRGDGAAGTRAAG